MWIYQLLLSLIAVASVYQIGFIFDFYLISRRKTPVNLFLAYALGLGIIGLFQIVISLFGIALNRYAVFFLIILSFFPFTVDKHIRKEAFDIFSNIKHGLKSFPKVFWIAASIFVGILAVLTFSHLIWGYDAWGFWLSKGRAFWIDGRITRDNLYLYWPYDHPILWPLVAAWFYHVVGESGGFWIRLIPLFTYISLVGVFFSFLRQKGSWRLVWTVILALTPFLWGNVVFVEYGGNADLFISFYFLLTVIVFLTEKSAVYASLFLSFAIFTKNDALPAAVLFIIGLPLISKLQKDKKGDLSAWLTAVAFFIFNIIWKNYYGLSNRYEQQNLSTILSNRSIFKYMWYTLHAFREEFRQVSRWGVGWWLIFFSLIINFKKIWHKKPILFVFLILAGQFLSYMWIYYITPENQATHITTSIFRLALQLYPSMLYIASFIFI